MKFGPSYKPKTEEKTSYILRVCIIELHRFQVKKEKTEQGL